MKKKLRELIQELRRLEFKALFGRSPRLLVELTDPSHSQICLTDEGDYVNLEEAAGRLIELANYLLLIDEELKKNV